MSAFLNLTPIVRVVIENPFFAKTYPAEGTTFAVIDTGYEGFLAIPGDAFRSLSLHELYLERRTLILANGSRVRSEGAYATLRFPQIPFRADGFVETYEGLDEVIVGAEALLNFRVLLNYCAKRVRLEACP